VGWHQLICASRGVLTVHAAECSWTVPPHRAVWLPVGLKCTVEMHGETALRILYLRGRMRLPVSVVNVSGLMRELVERAVRTGALDAAIPAQKRLAGVIRDEIQVLQSVPLQLPAPRDARARKLAELADSGGSFDRIPEECGASRRTMERLFAGETGMSLGQWLRRHRLMRALRMLGAGEAVKEVAAVLGYGNSSAFIAMFRRETGYTPTEYFS
jgi:AraC-like DNA-binding protein